MANDDSTTPRSAASERTRRTPLRASREARVEIKALSKPSTWRAWFALASDWVQISLAGLTIYWAVWLSGNWLAMAALPFAWLVIGIRMRALATILHEASHRALAHSRWLNIVMGTVCSGWWILQLHWRYCGSHISRHHVWLGHLENDPDIVQYQRLGLLKQNPATFLGWNLLQMLLGLKTFANLPYLLRDRLLPEPGEKLERSALVEIAGFIVTWTALLIVLSLTGLLVPFLLIWVVPYLTTFQAINHLIETLEHFPLTWTRQDAFEWTRNRKGPWFEQWLLGAHGEGWHRVHHLLPGVPFWNLERAHKILMTDPLYAAFERESGGVFFRGANGAPPIIKAMVSELTAYQIICSIRLEEIRS